MTSRQQYTRVQKFCSNPRHTTAIYDQQYTTWVAKGNLTCPIITLPQAANSVSASGRAGTSSLQCQACTYHGCNRQEHLPLV